MLQDESSVSNQLYELAMHHILAKSISVAAKLRLDKLLTDEPMKIDALAKQLNFHPKALWRLLRLLDAYDIVELVDQQAVKASKLTAHIKHICSPHIFNSYECINDLEYCLQNDAACYRHVFGEDFYPHILSNSGQTKMFVEWCTASMRNWMESVFELYDFSKYERLIDIGGGQGHFLATILNNNPKSQGVLFDQAEIIAQAKTILDSFSVADRTELVIGDFFKAVPSVGDLYIICRTLLNWNDEDAAKILNTCYASMPADAKLIIVDFCIPEKNHPHYRRGLLSDLNLYALINSSNRTLDEWQHLLTRTSFKLENIYISKENAKPEPIMPICILELVK